MPLANRGKLAIGNHVCIRLEGLHPRGRMEIPNGDVTGIKEDGIYINIPAIDSKYLKGRNVEVLWEKGMCLYCLSSKIYRCIQKQDTMLVVSPSNMLRSIDKRRYFRLKQPVHLEFRPKDKDYKGLFISADCKDISGGGIRFKTKYPLNCGQQLEMLLEIPIFPYLDISALAVVVRAERLKDNGGRQVGVHFMDMEPIGKKRLLKYLMDEQKPLNDRKNKGKIDRNFGFS